MRKKSVIAAVAAICICCLCFFAGCENYDYYEHPEKTYEKGHEFDEGCGNYNNGYDKESAEVDRLISVVPSQVQLDFMELEYYNFIHFGMNTMTGAEWGTGDEDPALFNPSSLDTDQWCEALKASGSKGIIITAKHHDGFCLWQTETTEQSIKNSPYKNGNGDVVKELSESCEKYGLKLGIYLSPWDMNAETYGTNAYNEFYMDQLRELLGGEYGPDFDGDGKGEIFCVWMDGALGEDVEMDKDFAYDLEAWEALIRELQPGCVVANQGSDVRWVGNEAGSSRESEWNVVSKGNAANTNWQGSVDEADDLQAVDASAEDVGSRELLAKYQDLVWYPSEVDVSIRKGWFWHSYEKPKSLDQLLNIYYKAVGGNSSLLLNVPPNKDGLIDEKDVEVLAEFGEEIARTTAKLANVTSISVGDNEGLTEKPELYNLLDESTYDGYTFEDNEYIIEFKLSGKLQLGRIDLREDSRSSQRVEEFEVWVLSEDGWELIGDSTVIGNRRILLFEDAPESDTVRVVIKQSRSVPVLRSVKLYAK